MGQKEASLQEIPSNRNENAIRPGKKQIADNHNGHSKSGYLLLRQHLFLLLNGRHLLLLVKSHGKIKSQLCVVVSTFIIEELRHKKD